MKKEYEASCGWPITDDSQSLQRFCSKLEHLLQIGLRGTVLLYSVNAFVSILALAMGYLCVIRG